jgi:hypothetical protein
MNRIVQAGENLKENAVYAELSPSVGPHIRFCEEATPRSLLKKGPSGG